MWFRTTAEDRHARSLRTHRRITRSGGGSPPLAVGRINIEPLEDRRVLSFTPAVDYPVGEYPTAIVSADFNADGRLDLATSNYSSSNVSVMLGNADGTFQATQTSATGSGPLSLAVGDFNGDGKLDLATANSGDVSVLLGNGNGTFQAPTSIYIGSSPSSVAVGDFNNDGKLDLGVTSNFYYPGYSSYYGGAPAYYTGHANVLLGNGGGSFAAPNTTWLGYGGHTSATLADFNGDGKLDFASISSEYGNVVVLLGTGTGVLGAPNYFSSSYGSRVMTAGDVNADGKLDLLAANASNSSIGVLLGNGTGSFGASQFYAAGSYPFSVALGDFNGDGKADLVTTNQSNSTVSVLLGTGTGTFRPPVAAPTGISPYDLVIGDFNSDGRLDAATANFFDNSVSVLLNDGIWPALDAPSIAISDATVNEGNAGTVGAVFTVSLSAAYSQNVSVRYATTDGFATVANGDYQATSGTLTFAPGQTSKTITVLVNGDRLAEYNETFSLRLTDTSNVFLADALGAGTILDDEPYLSINTASGAEGNVGTTPMTFTVTLSAPSDAPVKVSFATADYVDEWTGTPSAVAGVDYQATSGTLTFAPGETSKLITVLVIGDRIGGEYDKYFLVNLGDADGAGLSVSQTWGLIQDDEPNVSIGYANVAEGDGGTTPFVFTVSLSAAYDAPIAVSYITSDGSASAGSDYVATSGTVTFAPGDTSQTITVLVNGDTVFEGDEYFNVSLVDADSATIYSGPGYGNIVDDDDNTPQISISDVTKNEGNSGSTAFVFTVSLSAASSSRVTVHYATDNGSATANGDYQSASGNVTFAAGQTSKTITVQAKGDTTTESDETFLVNLSNASGAAIADGQGQGTILNDDNGRQPQIRVSDVTRSEGNSGTTSFVFTVSLSAASSERVTVHYATANGSAKKNDNDYVAESGKLTFRPGETTKTIAVSVKGDKRNESNESFFVNLSNAKGALIDDDQGEGTILNDDGNGKGKWYNQLVFASAVDAAFEDWMSPGRKKRGW